MMPQKRNPDALSCACSGARAIGDLTTLLATLKGIPSGYNKDLQDDKRVLFDAVVTRSCSSCPLYPGALQEISLQPQRMRAALSSSYEWRPISRLLVEKGASFRRPILNRLFDSRE